MNEYVILVGLTTNSELRELADSERSTRLWAICDLLFSLGPAWHGNQGSILLKSSLSGNEIVERLTPLVGGGDLVAVMAISAKSLTTIGWIADEEGLDALWSNVVKVEGTRGR